MEDRKYIIVCIMKLLQIPELRRFPEMWGRARDVG